MYFRVCNTGLECFTDVAFFFFFYRRQREIFLGELAKVFVVVVLV